MSELTPIGVIVADDHPLFREGLTRAITERAELELLAEVSDGREAVELIDELRPDVAVLDIRMPGLEGPQALEALRARGNDAKVVFLSAFVNGELVHEALSSGAMGFLSKEAGRQEICDAIVEIARGELFVDPRIQSGLLRAVQRGGTGEGPELSERELDVLRLAADGLSTAQIAGELHLSPETVKSHMKTLFGKLGVTARTTAVAEAIRRGILD